MCIPLFVHSTYNHAELAAVGRVSSLILASMVVEAFELYTIGVVDSLVLKRFALIFWRGMGGGVQLVEMSLHPARRRSMVILLTIVHTILWYELEGSWKEIVQESLTSELACDRNLLILFLQVQS